jgi:hypothetical protein
MFDAFHEEFLFFLAEQWPLSVQDPFVSDGAVDNVRNLASANFAKSSSNYQGCFEKHWTLTYEVQLHIIATLKNPTSAYVTDSSKTSAIIDVRVPVQNQKAFFSKATLSVS